MFRLLTYDLLGIGTLLLPSALAEYAGKNAMAAIIAGMAAGLIYCALVGWAITTMEEGESYPQYLKRAFGKIIGTAALLLYVLDCGRDFASCRLWNFSGHLGQGENL